MCTCFFFFLRPYLGPMRVPVLGYSLTITFMLMMAAFRNMRVNQSSFEMIMIGALFFYVSDALLAINRFVTFFSLANLAIMVTYMIAQYLITMGAINRTLLNKN
ncbi:MAG: lysoplasmalogenase [Sphingobacteriales bacterium]|nr:MAG: lysoplasmalogenase [Sphingobacteriales bacterium]